MSVDYTTKRPFDLAVSSIGLALFSPILAVLAFAVKVTSPGPAFHRATRVGRNGTPFVLYKFRTMRVNAVGAGPAITATGDSRITRLGRILRLSKLDELPQLLNVVRGEMSVVGPRPEDPRYVAGYDEHQREILRWRPGITSPASVTYRDEEHILAENSDLEAAYAQVAADKIRIDLDYFPGATLRSDLGWIVRTATAVVRRSDS